VEIRDKILCLNPCLPEELQDLRLSIHYRGHWLRRCVPHEPCRPYLSASLNDTVPNGREADDRAPKQHLLTTHWHTLDVQAMLDKLGSSASGLTPSEAKDRLEQFGPNRLRPPQRHSPLIRLPLQFHNILIYILLVAGLAAVLLQHWIDTGVILGVVVINALIGFIQEGKAEKALEAITRLLSLEATVIRDGKRQSLPAEALVPVMWWCCAQETRSQPTCTSRRSVNCASTKPCSPGNPFRRRRLPRFSPTTPTWATDAAWRSPARW
jgi:Cation transporter/ATPase, N-terminus/Glycosyl hydrolase family 65, C-terminal domain